jgi:hypothetical protein
LAEALVFIFLYRLRRSSYLLLGNLLSYALYALPEFYSGSIWLGSSTPLLLPLLPVGPFLTPFFVILEDLVGELEKRCCKGYYRSPTSSFQDDRREEEDDRREKGGAKHSLIHSITHSLNA